ncbi:MAG: Gfo/Idh/MocA family oxidoreductase [Magnetococcales bacterium]|nr:Gfo/Idh/MocA family oxidoreductase [Magnetococcales bacterium]
MSEQNRLRAGVIGVGYLGRFHAQKYAAIENVDLTAVVDTNPEQAEQVGNELGVPWFTDYRDMLDKVDLVSVGVPTVAHFRVTEACLRAGVHALVEKPFTQHLEEADDLITMAEASNLVLQVGHLKRFHPAVVALRQSTLLKTPRFIESHRLAPFKSRSLDVDVVMDLMIHDVDLILNFVGSELVEVEAMGTPVVTKQVDIANARLKFANGCIANVTASRVSRQATRTIRMFQDDAYIVLDFITKKIQVIHKTEGTMVLDGLEVPALASEQLPITDHDTLEMEVRSFCDAVRLGKPPEVSGRDGRKALEVVMAIRRSIESFSRSIAS